MKSTESIREVLAELESVGWSVASRRDGRWTIQQEVAVTAVHHKLQEILDALPPCPRCGGSGLIATDESDGVHCPDCPGTPGKAPIERLVKVFEAVQAVHSSGRWVEVNGWNTNDPAELLSHLRGI